MIEDFKSYVNTRVSLAKLELTERFAFTVSSLIFTIIVALLLLLFLITLTAVLGVYLSQLLDSFTLGFLALSSIYLLAMVLMILFKKPLKSMIMNWLICVSMKYNQKKIESDE